jgi:hypothetical protein
MPRRFALALLAVLVSVVAVVACNSSIQFPGQLVGSFNTTLVPQTNTCLNFSMLPGFCPENGSPGPCTDGGFPDGGTTVLVVSMGQNDAGYVSYQSGSQSSTATGTFDGQTVNTQALAERFFLLAGQPTADAGCIAQVTETIQLSIYASLDGGCAGGIPIGPPPVVIGGTYQTQASPACGLLVDVVSPGVISPGTGPVAGACCPTPLPDGGCATALPPTCSVSFGLVGQGRPSPP